MCDDLLTPEEEKEGIHIRCRSQFYPVLGAMCMHCGRPFRKLLRQNPFDTSTREYCEECKKRGYVTQKIPQVFRIPGRNNEISSAITQGRALYLYRGKIKLSMYRFKYSNKREYALFFAKEAVKRYPILFFQQSIDVIIPVPMYLPKQKKRGYNQAESFAKAISVLTGIPMDAQLMQRVRDTTPQKELNDIERKNNLKNAFQIRKSVVNYKKVLIVDDIYTTGSTVEVIAEQLKHIGIHQIYVLSICIGGEA